MATDKIRKYVLPNIPYLFIGWFCLKIGTAYRLAAGAGFGEKLLGLGQTIGAAFASFAPGLAPLDRIFRLQLRLLQCPRWQALSRLPVNPVSAVPPVRSWWRCSRPRRTAARRQ